MQFATIRRLVHPISLFSLALALAIMTWGVATTNEINGLRHSFIAGVYPGLAQAADQFIVLQSTTSTQNSGLFDHLLLHFQTQTGIEVRVVAVGTGQALKNAQNGDGDVFVRPCQRRRRPVCR